MASQKCIFMGTAFKTFCENLIFPIKYDCYGSEWLCVVLQFRKCPKGLYKMNTSPLRISLPISKGSEH